jgi:hypothetical protein
MYPSLQDLFRARLSVEYNSNEISFNTLLRVEIGLRLLEILGLEKGSVQTIWALNQGLNVPALTNLKLNLLQRKCLANFRVVIHRSSIRDWQNDFGIYAQYSEGWRLYKLSTDDSTFEKTSFVRTGRQSQRTGIYDDVFSNTLPFRKEKKGVARQGKYAFSINRDYKGEFVFSEHVIKEALRYKNPSLGKRQFRSSIQYSFEKLRQLAQELDGVEHSIGFKRPNKWLDRINRMVRFRARRPDGTLSEVNTSDLTIDGMTHIAGMVGSGKSSIATLIAYDIARHQKNQRITLVVADVAEVMRLTEYFNTLLAVDNPVAVPLLGPTMRNTHLTNVFRQKEMSIVDDQWKLRFLDTTCLVTQWLSKVDDTVTTDIPSGREPCNTLYEWDDKSEKKKHYLCPLFSICPIQQAYRDMPNANIWITTMGGLGQAKVPAQVDDRRPPLWLLIYENSSLVIFDEVDSIQGWFDKLLAPDLILDDTGSGGLLQDTLRKLGTYPSGIFRQDNDLDRWRQTYDLTMPALRNFLGLLERNDDLRNWLSVRPFTSLRILSELAGRISGYFLWDNEDAPKEVVLLNSRLRDLFIEMQQHDLSSITLSKPDPKAELILLSAQITSYGRGQINPVTNKSVETWVKKQIDELPISLQQEIAERAKSYAKKHSSDESGDPLDIYKLTHRLELGLVASILDRDLRGLFYGWHHVQQLLGEEGMPSLIPTSLSGLLPSPPLGRWRGFRTANDGDSNSKTLSLAIFEFAAVGRFFVQNFDRLLEDLDGQPGPNVLAMSGTSWMPDSARYHFDIPVAGILEPDKSIQDAIRSSTFTYLPQLANKNKSKSTSAKHIRISGAGKDMAENLEQLTLALAKKPDKFISPLAREIDKLDQLHKEGGAWEDRARILLLVNSYDQAQKVATLLQGSLRSDLANDVYAIVRSDDDTSDWDWRPYKAMKRSNVEDSGHLARVLVAPIGAIGRGYNIVSPKTGRAAYGSIYFLIRPMTPPFDAMTMVSGINHKLDQWLKADAHIWKKSDHEVLSQVSLLREIARDTWQSMERGKFYRLMEDSERKELAATTASSIIQACGRLVRGGVPFRAYFVDASWVNGFETDGGDFIAKPNDSLLAATIERLLHYTSSEIGSALYGAFYDGLSNPQGLQLEL